MPFNPTKTRTWGLTTPNNGTYIDAEVDQLYENDLEALLKTSAAKTGDYTVLNTDYLGVIRVANANSAVTGKAYDDEDPCGVASTAHGLTTGASVLVSVPSAADIQARHYDVTKDGDNAFTLDDCDNTAGTGGTLTYKKDVVITLPAAAAANLDRRIVVINEGADGDGVKIVVGSDAYYLTFSGDALEFYSNGSAWVGMPGARNHPQRYIAMMTQLGMLSAYRGVYNIADRFTTPTVTVSLPELAGQGVKAIIFNVTLSDTAGVPQITLGPTANGAEVHQLFGIDVSDIEAGTAIWSGSGIIYLGPSESFRAVVAASTTVQDFKIIGYLT